MTALLYVTAILIAVAGASPVSVQNRPPPERKEPIIDVVYGMKEYVGRAGIRLEEYRWPNATVTYMFQKGYDELPRSVMLAAMEEIQKKTCVKFRKRKEGERSYIYIKSVDEGQSCSSYIGYQEFDQPLSFGEPCANLHRFALHEIMHALGFAHEFQRSDRDDYLIIHWDNILKKYHSEFDKVEAEYFENYTPFDFHSVLMYDNDAGAKEKNLMSMEAKEGYSFVRNITELSKYDVEKINKMYKCNKY